MSKITYHKQLLDEASMTREINLDREPHGRPATELAIADASLTNEIIRNFHTSTLRSFLDDIEPARNSLPRQWIIVHRWSFASHFETTTQKRSHNGQMNIHQ